MDGPMARNRNMNMVEARRRSQMDAVRHSQLM
ncbi:unnamed protein product [Mycena citricolor]|uniref:Uncharacterized protein n=1 Tax=Mycena citricolor TaxID=2018698 RepID=A0AAD2GWG1_9AGAR|nr:unnamed protein product [Mycena citricolor]